MTTETTGEVDIAKAFSELPYDSIDEALAIVAGRPQSLALYLFTYNRTLQQRVMTQTHAGSMAINDMPLGGIGPPGMGQNHRHEGFLTLSQAKAILIKQRLNAT